jgi:hypothetical protein
MGLGSEIRDPEKHIPDPGSRGQKGTGSRIRIRTTGLVTNVRVKSTTGIILSVLAKKKFLPVQK